MNHQTSNWTDSHKVDFGTFPPKNKFWVGIAASKVHSPASLSRHGDDLFSQWNGDGSTTCLHTISTFLFASTNLGWSNTFILNAPSRTSTEALSKRRTSVWFISVFQYWSAFVSNVAQHSSCSKSGLRSCLFAEIPWLGHDVLWKRPWDARNSLSGTTDTLFWVSGTRMRS